MLTVKIQHGDDIRRISLHEDSSNLTVSDLYKRIHMMFPSLQEVPYDRLFISYRDTEGDTVRITNDLEYAEAVHALQPDASGVRLLRLTIQTKLGTSQVLYNLHSQTSQTLPPHTQATQTQTSSSFQTQPPFSLPHISPQGQQIPPVSVAAMMGVLPSVVSHINTQAVDPIARMVASILTSQPGATAFTPLTVPPETVAGLMQNIGQLIPPEQLMPAMTSIMQSPAIQQMIPQILNSIFGAQATAQATAPAQATASVQTTSPQQAPSSPHVPISAVEPILPFSNVNEHLIERPISAGSGRRSELTHTSSSSGSPVVINKVSKEEGQASPATGKSGDQFTGSRFGDLLQQLAEIGFTDQEKNIQILAKHSGDMNRVVDDLVADQQE